MPPTKKVRLYPYQIKLHRSLSNSDVINEQKWSEKFTRRSVGNNLVPVGQEYHLALIVDASDNGFTVGKFLKLRDDKPTIIDKKTGVEKEIDLLASQNIIETSHFVANLNDRILFGEFNFNAIRFFSTPLEIYLEKIFQIPNDKLDIVPIENKDTYKNMKADKDYTSVVAKIGSYNMGTAEKEKGVPIFGRLMGLSQSGDVYVEVRISKTKKHEDRLKNEKVWEFAEKHKDNEDLSSFKVETRNAVYDLLKNNLVYYFVNLTFHSRKINSEDFYAAAKALYQEKADILKSSLD